MTKRRRRESVSALVIHAVLPVRPAEEAFSTGIAGEKRRDSGNRSRALPHCCRRLVTVSAGRRDGPADSAVPCAVAAEDFSSAAAVASISSAEAAEVPISAEAALPAADSGSARFHAQSPA